MLSNWTAWSARRGMSYAFEKMEQVPARLVLELVGAEADARCHGELAGGLAELYGKLLLPIGRVKFSGCVSGGRRVSTFSGTQANSRLPIAPMVGKEGLQPAAARRGQDPMTRWRGHRGEEELGFLGEIQNLTR